MKYTLLIIILAGVFYLTKNSLLARKESKQEIQGEAPREYHYSRKNFLMTKAENDFFDVLVDVLGAQYYVFPQIHLSSLLDHRVKGQSWRAAFSHINQKSVDYVVCGRQYRNPILAIELDDWSHDSDERKERDTTVDQMLKESGVPLLRIRDARDITPDNIRARLDEYLPKNTDSYTTDTVSAPRHDTEFIPK
ncbi:MAG: hypothetical protein QG629_133 [Patescibacteria group bacterium]|nr:DUF2726 domain-containing protein [Candidatus Saccharibacteria bacterium]MDQ5963051.1 hypothetical protein [Patescibacteria group bacterium]